MVSNTRGGRVRTAAIALLALALTVSGCTRSTSDDAATNVAASPSSTEVSSTDPAPTVATTPATEHTTTTDTTPTTETPPAVQPTDTDTTPTTSTSTSVQVPTTTGPDADPTTGSTTTRLTTSTSSTTVPTTTSTDTSSTTVPTTTSTDTTLKPSTPTSVSPVAADGSPDVSVSDLVDDMILNHEGQMHGVPDNYSWAFVPEKIERYPDDFKAFMVWGQVYEDAQGNPASNSRVALRDITAWVRLKSTGEWKRLQHSTSVEGAAFLENFATNEAVGADERFESDGSVSVTVGDGTNYHFWARDGRVSLDSSDIAGLAMTLDARLVLDDPNREDDRGDARYLVGVGADLWKDAFVGHNPPHTIQAVGLGRMHYVTEQWQTVTMTTLDGSELAANPPSFITPG